jgi:hypothetical protein
LCGQSSPFTTSPTPWTVICGGKVPLSRPALTPWTGAPCSPEANVGRERRGEAPSNVLCQLSESIRRNTHIRPTLACGEHGAPVQGSGLVEKREFTHTNYRPLCSHTGHEVPNQLQSTGVSFFQLKWRPRMPLMMRWSVPAVGPRPTPMLISHFGDTFRSVTTNICCCW